MRSTKPHQRDEPRRPTTPVVADKGPIRHGGGGRPRRNGARLSCPDALPHWTTPLPFGRPSALRACRAFLAPSAVGVSLALLVAVEPRATCAARRFRIVSKLRWRARRPGDVRLPYPVEISQGQGDPCHRVACGPPIPLNLALWRRSWAVTFGLDRQSPPQRYEYLVQCYGYLVIFPGPAPTQPRIVTGRPRGRHGLAAVGTRGLDPNGLCATA